MKSVYAIGVDIGGTKIVVGAVDRSGAVWARRTIATEVHLGFEAGLTRLCRAVDETLAEARRGLGALVGIGLGCAGPSTRRAGESATATPSPAGKGTTS